MHAALLLAPAQTKWKKGGKGRDPELSLGEILERVAQPRAALQAVPRYLCMCVCVLSVSVF
jgi:hypothetical protein